MRENIKSEYIGIALISLISIGLYLNSLNSSFHFDDMYSIVENPYIKNLKDIPFFLEGIKVHSKWYRVLLTLSFAINYHFHKLNVLGYHLTNLMFHILSGILVYFISRNLFALALKKIEISHNHKNNPENEEISLLSLLTALIFIAHSIQANTLTYNC